MYHKCPASCGVCEQSICADSNTTQCHIWHDSGECERNPMAVMKDCPATCGVCSTVCTDHDEGCKGWAAAGKCTAEGEEEAFMYRVCPASCGVCTAIDKGKDEL